MSGAGRLHAKNVVLSALVLVSSLFLVVTLIHSSAGASEITIGDPFALPATVLWYLEANVMLNVTAVHSVDTVILSYTTNHTNTWQNITMTHVPPGSGQQFENSYEATLPPQTPFTRLTFLVIANDTLGNYAVKNNTAICYIDYEIPEFPVPSFILATFLTLTVVVMLTYAFRRNRRLLGARALFWFQLVPSLLSKKKNNEREGCSHPFQLLSPNSTINLALQKCL